MEGAPAPEFRLGNNPQLLRLAASRRIPLKKPLATLCASSFFLPARLPGGEDSGAKALPPVTESVVVSITNIEWSSPLAREPHLGPHQGGFRVLQDGVGKEITNFYAVSGGKVTLEGGKTVDLEAGRRAPRIPETLQGATSSTSTNAHIRRKTETHCSKVE